MLFCTEGYSKMMKGDDGGGLSSVLRNRTLESYFDTKPHSYSQMAAMAIEGVEGQHEAANEGEDYADDDGWLSILICLFRIVACCLTIMVTTFVWVIIMLALLPWPYARVRQGNIYGHFTGRLMMLILGNPIRIDGMEYSDKTAIYISNHASSVDLFLMMWLTPTGSVSIAKKEIIWYPLFGLLFFLANHLRIDRSNSTTAVESMKEVARAVVQNNLSLVIFPEGTRSSNGKLLPFKKGFVHLALQTRLPIVPMVLTGTHNACRKGSIRVRPAPITVKYLPPIKTEDWTEDNVNDNTRNRVPCLVMEKALQNSDSPVGVLEDYLRTIETDTNSSNESQKTPKTASRRWHTFVELLLRTKSKNKLPEFMPKLTRWRRSSSTRERTDEFHNADSPCRNFTLSELQLATSNFSQEKVIGKGGYAEVYKGRLQDGEVVAVKRLSRGTPEERIADFLSELGIMAHVNHPNIIPLIGYGVEGGMHLLLQYSHLGSLATVLHGSSKEKLSWIHRYNIALGVAEGLMYLHYGCQRRIIHRDIKAANILLKENFEPQICDFGLAKWLPDKWTHHIVMKFEGTFGYLAPEFLMHGIVDEKTDVFAFGVLLLELITGRRALDCSRQSLVMWAKPLLMKNNVKELIDPALADSFNAKQMNLMVLASALCVQRSSIRRPQMNQVLQLLKGNLGSIESSKKYRKPSFWKMYYDEIMN